MMGHISLSCEPCITRYVVIIARKHHKKRLLLGHVWICIGVFIGTGTSLALVWATSREGQTIREGGTESRGSL